MKDELEQFIEDNRNELDTFEPRKKIWDAIDGNLAKKQRNKRFTFSAAASIALIVGIGMWMLLNRNEQEIPIVSQTPSAVEVKSAEVYYASMIEEKRNELNKYCNTQPQLCRQFDKELDTLDILYGQLKQEYVKSADKEVVLSAMIQNLQVQLQVLSQQLQVIHNINTKQQQQDKVL